ncbi:MAG: hypothetical protein Q4G27_00050 [Flavobacteriaceae bacterium]|nr:hypothetical protein [Flavobacteriaceae bacterium]
MILSPVLGFSFELNHEKLVQSTCCHQTETPTPHDACHELSVEIKNCHADVENSSQPSCKDKCKDNCSNHACHVLVQTIQSPDFCTSCIVKISSIESTQPVYHQDLSLQNFIFLFWNPPKFVA